MWLVGYIPTFRSKHDEFIHLQGWRPEDGCSIFLRKVGIRFKMSKTNIDVQSIIWNFNAVPSTEEFRFEVVTTVGMMLGLCITYLEALSLLFRILSHIYLLSHWCFPSAFLPQSLYKPSASQRCYFNLEDGDNMLVRNDRINLRKHKAPKPKTTSTSLHHFKILLLKRSIIKREVKTSDQSEICRDSTLKLGPTTASFQIFYNSSFT
jgi:hypothetical protein